MHRGSAGGKHSSFGCLLSKPGTSSRSSRETFARTETSFAKGDILGRALNIGKSLTICTSWLEF
jgi:hypothetical protein